MKPSFAFVLQIRAASQGAGSMLSPKKHPVTPQPGFRACRWVYTLSLRRKRGNEPRNQKFGHQADSQTRKNSFFFAVFRHYSSAELVLSWHNPLQARNPPRYLDQRYQGLSPISRPSQPGRNWEAALSVPERFTTVLLDGGDVEVPPNTTLPWY